VLGQQKLVERATGRLEAQPAPDVHPGGVVVVQQELAAVQRRPGLLLMLLLEEVRGAQLAQGARHLRQLLVPVGRPACLFILPALVVLFEQIQDVGHVGKI